MPSFPFRSPRLLHPADAPSFPRMSFTGTIENGVVKLPSGLGLPDGTQVRVEPITKPTPRNELTRRLAEIAGKVSNLPADFAAEHDHYLHGTAKRAQ